MAISTEARTELLTVVVAMFDAAPGVGVLSDLSAAYESGATVAQIAASLAASAEFKSIYPTFLSNTEFATQFVDNLLGSTVSATTRTFAIGELTTMLNNGMTRSETVLAAVAALNGVPSTDTNWANAKAQLANKVEVANHHTVVQKKATTNLNDLQEVVAEVDATAASVTAAKAEIDGEVAAGQTYNFTTGIDNLTGTSGNDTFGATVTATSAVLGGLDKVDGGAGTDTVAITDTATGAAAQFSLPGVTFTNIEAMELQTNGGVNVDVSAVTGLTSFTSAAAGTANTAVTAATTTDVKTTVTGAATTTITGGKAINVTAGTGATTVNSNGATTVSVKGGGAVDINNNSATLGNNNGSTMTEVTLDSVNAAAAADGRALATLNLTGATNATYTTTISNSTTGGHAFTINANNAGINSGSATNAFLAGGADVDSTTATSLTINSGGSKNSLDIAGFTAAKSITITGGSALTLNNGVAATVTSVDGSAATAALTLGTLAATVTTVKTGTGNDSFTLGAAKLTVESGAGDDSVTLGGAVAAGSTINLGAGNDKLLVNGGSVAASTSTTIDGGEGNDTVAAGLINAANAARFVNFEALDLSTTATLDVELMTGSTISSLTLSGGTGGATVSNVSASTGLSVTGNNTGTTTIGLKSTSGTSDAYTVTFAGTTGTVAAGTVKTDGVENVTVVSNGSSGTNTITIDGSTLKTVTASGSKALTLSFAATAGDTAPGTGVAAGVTAIDGSAATGVLTINTTNVQAATAGLTVTGGSANDVITLAGKATVVGGAGNDTITTSAAGGTLTGGAGNDKFDVAASVATGATAATATNVTITDFAVGDSIKLLAGNVLAGATLGAKTTLTAAVTTLDSALTLASLTDTANEVSWFTYGSDTYIVANDGTAGLAAGDLVIKLTGTLDLSGSTLDTATDYLTFA
ncbi:hypothetical protein QGM61_10230 [Pseudohongiella sp. SYSU M77423]|uniref:beta strand repeat-containing protein n=1 Tax=Pseudohongiella sp. SYSU M77423 TaxID=3042312 RepID=UPI002480583F|nr:hypothetical protein [Pseudohongiella sp. SYSU M77423]MDH7944195.1 hypothetical protein [Pseudohongiella sp. SYSU M77423]